MVCVWLKGPAAVVVGLLVGSVVVLAGKVQLRCRVVQSSQQGAFLGISRIQVGYSKVCCPGLSPWAEAHLPPVSLAGAPRSVIGCPSPIVCVLFDLVSLPWFLWFCA